MPAKQDPGSTAIQSKTSRVRNPSISTVLLVQSYTRHWKKKAHFSNQEACFAAESLSILHMEMLEAHELCIKSIFLQISNKKWEWHRLIWKMLVLFMIQLVVYKYRTLPHGIQLKASIKCFNCLTRKIFALESTSARNVAKGKQLLAKR